MIQKKYKSDDIDKKDPLVQAIASGVKQGFDLLNEELCHSDKLHHDMSELI